MVSLTDAIQVLYVLDGDLICEVNVKSVALIDVHLCEHLQPDVVNISCSARYTGGQSPNITWRNSDGELVVDNITNSDLPNYRVATSILVPSNISKKDARYTCEIAVSFNSSIQISLCPTPKINIDERGK